MITIGMTVSWQEECHRQRGIVTEVYHAPTSHILDGQPITSMGSLADPAYLITSQTGQELIKRKSEIRPESNSLAGKEHYIARNG
ncbi:MAG: DUF2945 domain-containing protein [Anaerolineales bacterium]